MLMLLYCCSHSTSTKYRITRNIEFAICSFTLAIRLSLVHYYYSQNTTLWNQ